MGRKTVRNRYTLAEDIKANAPLLAALDNYKDATGEFAEWLERKKLIIVYYRYGINNYPCSFYYDQSKWNWPELEKAFLVETMQYYKAKDYSDGKNLPFNFTLGSLIFELLKFAPVLLLMWLFKK